MTDRQKDMIRQMRAEGYGYIRIAQELGISENTVKSFCQRKGLSAGKIKAAVPSADGSRGICPCCGAKVVQNPGRKAKKFCSDKCRNKWWNSHPEQVGRNPETPGSTSRRHACSSYTSSVHSPHPARCTPCTWGSV